MNPVPLHLSATDIYINRDTGEPVHPGSLDEDWAAKQAAKVTPRVGDHVTLYLAIVTETGTFVMLKGTANNRCYWFKKDGGKITLRLSYHLRNWLTANTVKEFVDAFDTTGYYEMHGDPIPQEAVSFKEKFQAVCDLFEKNPDHQPDYLFGTLN